jgi:hypothetical protein
MLVRMLGENKHRREAGRPAANRLVSCDFRICLFFFRRVFASNIKIIEFRRVFVREI